MNHKRGLLNRLASEIYGVDEIFNQENQTKTRELKKN